jgi:hypothetical protein
MKSCVRCVGGLVDARRSTLHTRGGGSCSRLLRWVSSGPAGAGAGAGAVTAVRLEKDIRIALANIMEPYTQRGILSAGIVQVVYANHDY